MYTNVKIKSQQKKLQKVARKIQLLKAGTTYTAFGIDALLLSKSLKLTFWTKKISGKCFHSTSFHESNFDRFVKILNAGGLTVAVEEII